MTSETKSTSFENADVYAALLDIQQRLKVEKAQYNSFGKYKFRSKEDILEALKPLAHENRCVVVVNDKVLEIGGWVYSQSVAHLINVDSGHMVMADGYAREPEELKGQSASQITGTSASYSGKRALGNLFSLDDQPDADKLNDGHQEPTSDPFDAVCTACGQRYRFDSVEQLKQSACQCGNRQFRSV